MKTGAVLTSRRDGWLRPACIALLVALLVAVIPILYMSFFAHTAMDDYAFGRHNAIAIRHHESLLRSVLYTVRRYYGGWQGTFSAVALMSLVPSIFGEQFYFLTAFVMLGMLVFSTCKLCRTLSVRLLRAPGAAGMALSLTLLILSVCLLPSPNQAFYWWNGAMFYTFFYGLMLLFLDQLLLLYHSESRRARIGHFLAAAALSVLVGGGNYVSALLAVELCALWLISVFRNRKDLRVHAAVLFVLLIACFACSVLAPGNAIRQAGETGGYGPIQAVLRSVLQAGKDFFEFFDPTVYLCLLLGVLAFSQLVPDIAFDFRHPAAVQLLAFLLYASQHAPHLYAVGTSGPGRMQDIFFFSHLWLLFFSAFYWTGFFAKRFSLARLRRVRRPLALVLGLLLICAALVQCLRLKTVPAIALRETINGSAAAFDREMDRRMELYEDPTVRDVYLTPIVSRPDLLFVWDNNADPENWDNTAISSFYEKDSVRLVPTAQ